jgi:chromosome segregation ATPase
MEDVMDIYDRLARLEAQAAAKKAEMDENRDAAQKLRDEYNKMYPELKAKGESIGRKAWARLEEIDAELNRLSARGHVLNNEYLRIVREANDQRAVNQLNNYLSKPTFGQR